MSKANWKYRANEEMQSTGEINKEGNSTLKKTKNKARGRAGRKKPVESSQIVPKQASYWPARRNYLSNGSIVKNNSKKVKNSQNSLKPNSNKNKFH
jgi:hypothetical protein